MKTALILLTVSLLSFNLTACGKSTTEKKADADEKALKEYRQKRNQF